MTASKTPKEEGRIDLRFLASLANTVSQAEWTSALQLRQRKDEYGSSHRSHLLFVRRKKF
jgi:hypothetical protein